MKIFTITFMLASLMTPLPAQWAQYHTPAILKPGAQALIHKPPENFGGENPHYKCLPQGPIYTTAGGFKRLIQTPAMMVILNDDLTYRPIFTDGRALESDPNPSWMGYS